MRLFEMKSLIIFITFAVCVLRISAQENFYEFTKTFNEDGYTYQCDVDKSKLVTLYNKENKLTYIEKKYRDTGKQVSMLYDNKKEFETETWTKPKCFSIVNKAFSSVEKQRVKGVELTISLYIDPDSGEVLEVEFQFTNFRPYATIPISVYRRIELDLKKNIRFTPTAEGKKLNYIFLWWRQEIK